MISVSLSLRDTTGQGRGHLVVSKLPGGSRLALGEPISLMEGQRIGTR